MSEFKLEAFSAEEDILNRADRNRPNVQSPGGAFEKFFSMFGGGGGSGGGSGGQEYGGLSAQDKEMKKLIYDKIKTMFDQEHVPYEGDMFTDRSPEELALLEELKGGGGYQEHYDTAARNLGFSGDVYKTGAEYGVSDLDRDTSELMAGDPYRTEVSDRILRDMNRGASMSGMDLTGKQNFGGTGGGDRADLARLRSNLGYSEKAGDALSNLHYGALRDARGTARQLRQDRETSAGRFGSTALQKLGVGTGGLDKRYSTSLGAFTKDREYGDRDLKQARYEWEQKQNFPYKQLGFGTGLYSGMPFEEKVATTAPASGGK